MKIRPIGEQLSLYQDGFRYAILLRSAVVALVTNHHMAIRICELDSQYSWQEVKVEE